MLVGEWDQDREDINTSNVYRFDGVRLTKGSVVIAKKTTFDRYMVFVLVTL